MRKFFLLAVAIAALIFTGAGCVNIGGSASSFMGVYRTVDKGETWQPIFTLLTDQGLRSIGGMKIYRFFTDPSDQNALYAGTRGSGLLYSYNNGNSWQLSHGLENMFIYSLAVDPKNKCVIFATEGPHIFKTDDCMRSWTTVFHEERPDQRLASLAVDPFNSANVYGAELGGDILQSRDGGQSWHVIYRLAFDTRQLIADPAKQGRLYVAGLSNGLYRSDDGGTSWQDKSKPFDNFSGSKQFYRLLLNPAQEDSLFWLSKYGILRSDDSGENWADLKLLTPPGSVNIYSFAVNPQNQQEIYYTGTILGDNNQNVRSTFYKSADGGKNWVTRKLPASTIPVDMLVHRKSGNTIIMGFTNGS